MCGFEILWNIHLRSLNTTITIFLSLLDSISLIAIENMFDATEAIEFTLVSFLVKWSRTIYLLSRFQAIYELL